MISVHRGYWDVDHVFDDETSLYVYGDNDQHSGYGGQAVIRGLFNAAGIPTKKAPSRHPTSYYSDTEFEENVEKINAACAMIITAVQRWGFTRVVFPENGFGTGLAHLSQRAPNTYAALNRAVAALAENLERGSSKRLPFL